MENRSVGWLVLGISIVIIVIIFLFQSALKEIVTGSCTLAHGNATLCPMYKTINDQTYLALSLVGLLIIISFVLIFSKPQIQEKIVFKKIKEKIEVRRKPIDYSKLDSDEKVIVKILEENEGMFQSDIVEKSGFGKVKVTRILDKLEGRQVIERKRRGMNNFVVLK